MGHRGVCVALKGTTTHAQTNSHSSIHLEVTTTHRHTTTRTHILVKTRGQRDSECVMSHMHWSFHICFMSTPAEIQV